MDKGYDLMDDKWPDGFEWVKGVQQKSKKIQEDYEKQKSKKSRSEKRKEKWTNPYGINSMSDKEFIDNYAKLLKKSIFKGSIGVIVAMLVVLLFILAKEYINWGF